MMDPLSITAACFTLLATISKATYSLLEFSQGARDAEGDLDAIRSELHSFQNVIESLWQQTTKTDECPFPPNLEQQIIDALCGCNIVIDEIETCFRKHSKSVLGKSGYWTLGGGKNYMAERRARLEAQKSLLALLLQMANNEMMREIKKNTALIPSIKQDTARIPEAVGLKTQSSKDAAQSAQRIRKTGPKQWLEDMNNQTEPASFPFADEPPPEYKECMDNRDTVINQTCLVPQRRYNRSRPFLSVPFLQDAWNYSPISWSTSYYEGLSCSSGPHGWSTSSHSNVTPGPSGSSVFIKLAAWTDGSLLSPSLAFEPIYCCLPNNSPILHLGRFCAKRPQKPNSAYFDCAIVSRDHCDVCRNNNGKWYIKDLGSLTGTFLNSKRLSEPEKMSKWVSFREGDVIELGLFVKMTISVSVGWGSK